MKKIVMVLALTLTSGAFGQGTIDLRNFGSWGTRPLYYRLPSIEEIYLPADKNTMVEILAGTDAGSLSPVRSGNTWISNPQLFTLGTYTFPSVAVGQSVFVEVRYWKQTTGAGYESAQLRGRTEPFTVVTGQSFMPGSSILPGNFVNMPQTMPVPEPDAAALFWGGLCIVAVMLRKRSVAS